MAGRDNSEHGDLAKFPCCSLNHLVPAQAPGLLCLIPTPPMPPSQAPWGGRASAQDPRGGSGFLASHLRARLGAGAGCPLLVPRGASRIRVHPWHLAFSLELSGDCQGVRVLGRPWAGLL